MRAISLSSFALFHRVQYNCTDDSHVPGAAGARWITVYLNADIKSAMKTVDNL